MKTTVTPVKFPNRRGCELFGMLHEPERRSCESVIILLSPGIKSRVAPHRLYVKMAECFAGLGFTVLRIDPEGLGDCEGDIEEHLTADVYGSMELGRLVNDTIDTMNWIQSTYGIRSFILSGLCGGAITGLLTGAEDRRVVSLLSLGMTCVVSGSNLDPNKYITTGHLKVLRNQYLRKIWKPASWVRFITFRSDYSLLLKSLIQPILGRHQRKNNTPESSSTTLPTTQSIDTNLNPHFPGAFMKFAGDRKILLIFSGSDRLYWEFEEKFIANYHEAIAQFRANFDIHIIKDANHIFSFTEWQSEMLNVSTNWLKFNHLQADLRV